MECARLRERVSPTKVFWMMWMMGEKSEKEEMAYQKIHEGYDGDEYDNQIGTG